MENKDRNDEEESERCALEASSLKEKLKEWGNQLDPEQRVLLQYILSYIDHEIGPKDIASALILYDKSLEDAIVTGLRSAVDQDMIPDTERRRSKPWVLKIN